MFHIKLSIAETFGLRADMLIGRIGTTKRLHPRDDKVNEIQSDSYSIMMVGNFLVANTQEKVAVRYSCCLNEAETTKALVILDPTRSVPLIAV